MIRCKVPEGRSSGGTGIPWQLIGVEPIFARIPQESEMAHLQVASSTVIEVGII